MKQRNEKGALLIEILAVLGLLALITPMLFRQIRQRNEEIENVQIATEMRRLKDAAVSFINAYTEDISEELGLIDTDGNYKDVSTETRCSSIDLNGFDADTTGYNVCFVGYTGETDGQYYPVIYAIIYETNAGSSLRTSAAIAELIGMEGGVVQSTGIQGVGDSWSYSLIKAPLNAVAVTTIFETATLPSLLANHKHQYFLGDAVRAKGAIVGKEIAATNVLSIGGDGCITDATSLDEMSLLRVAGSNTDCQPIFHVAYDENGARIYAGTAIEFPETVSPNLSYNGEPIPSVAGENYKLDASYTSVMNDIALTSRGGAKLSEILPKYILKDIYEIRTTCDETADSSCISWNGSASSKAGTPTISANVTYPECPLGYKGVMTINPSVFDANYGAKTAEVLYEVEVEHPSPSETPRVSMTRVPVVSELKIADIWVEHTTVGGSDSSNVGLIETGTDENGVWSIHVSLRDRTLRTYERPILNQDDVKESMFNLIVKTYCVYDETNFNGLPAENAVRPPLMTTAP